MNTHVTQDTPEASPGAVGFAMQGDIAVLTIDNPPVNAGSHAVRRGITDGIAAAREAGATGAVLMGAGRCFVAGSDLREFGKPLAWPELPDVIATIEDAPFPVVAALHGVALGGGLELSLGCDYRIAAPDTRLGLPEVSLGFIPGAGGTQRMPRLTGRASAIDLICRAARIPATEALTLGLVDGLAEGDLLGAALAFLREGPRPKRLARTLPPPPEDEAAIDAAARSALKRGKGRPNIAEAIRLVRASDGDAEAMLAEERAVFQRLRLSDDAFALRYLFFAERKAGSVDGLDMTGARRVSATGVIGGGTMGQGIVRALLAAGLSVVLIERDEAALATALSAIEASLGAQVAKGRLSASGAEQRRAALSGAVDYGALSGCELVIEAVFEEMSVKQDVLARLEAALPAEAIIATNTSYLDIDEMVQGLSHPERVLGLHFFSPADVMKLLEVVRAAATSDAVLASGLKLAGKLGKQPVVARVGEGFIGNRIYAAYRRRAELLVLDGAAPEEVDAAATGFGFAMGPFAVSDMSGLDIAWAMRKRQAATRDPQARYVTIPDRLCEAGRLGRKTGKGWYAYGSGTAEPDPEVAALIDAARAEAGVSPQSFDAGTIQRQLLAAIVNEAACLLDEGIAQRASDVDVALTNGYGFPRWRGGPLYWAATEGRAGLEADLKALAAAIGHGFRAGPVAEVLAALDTGREV
ncbi:3-hydroxyacyl-CoA dehydrogenase NAD-binding domain-containing protein [Salipiger thiooxidans]|uniref:3-hydroxyacyl-CoA dehydrogenase NAD-binding domain-containing protein n=1 Tax=Salipiger thiooxidans TaxID=282683 RepID=UPI001CD31B4D|nr:3-hydroxyacyl-CoA dehydrogenase NAD-binding domain-containing protein [Salipiger thiooxidans]MCA0848547.1 enoyl-CoA hydratase/isomerase family protein [Salipiger thiooxidans]